MVLSQCGIREKDFNGKQAGKLKEMGSKSKRKREHKEVQREGTVIKREQDWTGWCRSSNL